MLKGHGHHPKAFQNRCNKVQRAQNLHVWSLKTAKKPSRRDFVGFPGQHSNLHALFLERIRFHFWVGWKNNDQWYNMIYTMTGNSTFCSSVFFFSLPSFPDWKLPFCRKTMLLISALVGAKLAWDHFVRKHWCDLLWFLRGFEFPPYYKVWILPERSFW